MKKRMTGIILISVGGLFVIIGVILCNNRVEKKDTGSSEMDKIIEIAIADGILTPNERTKIKEIANKNNIDTDIVIQQTETKLQNLNIDPETELVDYRKKNGDDFEKYIVERFAKNYFNIKSWAEDKYVNGRYAETTTQPDIQVEFTLGGEATKFALECKWRKQLYNNGFEFGSKEQLDKYNNFSKSAGIPVFVAIGIGGKGSSPESIYIIPLREIKQNFIHINELKKFEKKVGTNFYFNKEAVSLK